MNNSLKIGIIAGLIAGFVSGIVGFFSALFNFKTGLPYFFLPQPPETPFITIAMAEITIAAIWGIILGIIYSKIYSAIPGKGIIKGLVYGLGIYLIFIIRWATMGIVHGFILGAISVVPFIHPIIYGLVLGIIYKAPLEKLEIIKYDLKGGLHPGAIAGLVGGIAATVGLQIGPIFGLWQPFPAPPMLQVAALMVQDMVWGAIFGALYVMFYDRIPKKGIMKVLYFSLIVFLITSFRAGVYEAVYGRFIMAGWQFLPGLFHFIAFALVLGLLYRKPPK